MLTLAQAEQWSLPVDILRVPDPHPTEIANLAANLAAQQDVAYWTFVMAIASAAAVVISSLALIALLRSLKQTDTALKNTRTLGEMQTQAYVQAVEALWGPGGTVVIKCRNFGQSPATHFSINGLAKRAKLGAVTSSIEFKKTEFITWTALGPGQELTATLAMERRVLTEFEEAKFDPDEVLLVCGSIIYSTVFNHDHITDFVFFAHRNRPSQFSRPSANVRAFHRLEVPELDRNQFPSPWDAE